MRALLLLFLPVLLIAAWILSSLRAAEPGTANVAPRAPARVEIQDPPKDGKLAAKLVPDRAAVDGCESKNPLVLTVASSDQTVWKTMT